MKLLSRLVMVAAIVAIVPVAQASNGSPPGDDPAGQRPHGRALVLRFFRDVVNRGDLDAADRLFARNFVWHAPFSPEPLHGPEAVKQVVASFRTAFPDLRVTVEETVAERGKVVARVTATGTNLGELMGFRPTGKVATWSVFHIFRVRGDRIVEDRFTFDQLSLFTQLGLVTPPTP